MPTADLPSGPADGLLGRGRELRALHGALRQERLVAVTGPAGVGKTRLATAALAGEPPEAVRMVDLSGLIAPEFLACTLSRALSLPDRPDSSELSALARGLAARPTLLVLDGCERLAGQGADVIEYLLGACRELRILAVGRRALGLQGERILPLHPLAEGPAMGLLAARARSPVGGLAPLDALSLCHLLDRNPLAIELAARRLAEVDARQLMAEVARPAGLLALKAAPPYPRNLPQRHYSLRAAAEWSHDLCTEAEQLLWARLSAIRAGFDRAEAHRSCDRADLPEAVLEAAWDGLLRSSVLVPDGTAAGGGTGRYRLPALLRAYGRERLRDTATDRLHALHQYSAPPRSTPGDPG